MSGKPPTHPIISHNLNGDIQQLQRNKESLERSIEKFKKSTIHKNTVPVLEKKVEQLGRDIQKLKHQEDRTKTLKEKGIMGIKKGMNAGRRTTMRAGDRGGDIVTHMLGIRNQVKLYHWQTKQFARHKATDDLTASLDLNIDAFVESYMGRYGRPSVSGSIKLHNFSESAAKNFVARETKFLTVDLPKKLKPTDTDLLNIRDTILGDLTKTLYLFSLT